MVLGMDVPDDVSLLVLSLLEMYRSFRFPKRWMPNRFFFFLFGSKTESLSEETDSCNSVSQRMATMYGSVFFRERCTLLRGCCFGREERGEGDSLTANACDLPRNGAFRWYGCDRDGSCEKELSTMKRVAREYETAMDRKRYACRLWPIHFRSQAGLCTSRTRSAGNATIHHYLRRLSGVVVDLLLCVVDKLHHLCVVRRGSAYSVTSIAHTPLLLGVPADSSRSREDRGCEFILTTSAVHETHNGVNTRAHGRGLLEGPI